MHASEFGGPMELALPANLVAVFMQVYANGWSPRKLRLTEAFHQKLCDDFDCAVIHGVFGVPVETIPDNGPHKGRAGFGHLVADGPGAPLCEGGIALWFDERESFSLPSCPPPPPAPSAVSAPPPTTPPLLARLAKVYPAPD